MKQGDGGRCTSRQNPPSSPVAAEPGQFVVRPVAEKKLNGLPPGPLYWRIENFATLDQAQSAAAANWRKITPEELSIDPAAGDAS
jgi:hypothetical protein